jgi:hypothetical protein
LQHRRRQLLRGNGRKNSRSWIVFGPSSSRGQFSGPRQTDGQTSDQQTWCLSVCLSLMNERTNERMTFLDDVRHRHPPSNSPLICGPRWLCERRICAAPGIWARGQKWRGPTTYIRFLHFWNGFVYLCTEK